MKKHFMTLAFLFSLPAFSIIESADYYLGNFEQVAIDPQVSDRFYESGQVTIDLESEEMTLTFFEKVCPPTEICPQKVSEPLTITLPIVEVTETNFCGVQHFIAEKEDSGLDPRFHRIVIVNFPQLDPSRVDNKVCQIPINPVQGSYSTDHFDPQSGLAISTYSQFFGEVSLVRVMN